MRPWDVLKMLRDNSRLNVPTNNIQRMKRPGLVPLLLLPRIDGLGEVVLDFYFLRGGVVQCFVKALGVPPVHPPQGRQLNFSH